MFSRRQVTKIGIFISLALCFIFGSAFAGTAEEEFNKGAEYFKEGSYDEAITKFDNTIKIDPNNAKAFAGRAAAHLSKGNNDQAISDYSKAIEIDPNEASYYRSRAIAYFFKNDYGKAWKDVHKAESLGYKVNPNFLDKLKKASGREK